MFGEIRNCINEFQAKFNKKGKNGVSKFKF